MPIINGVHYPYKMEMEMVKKPKKPKKSKKKKVRLQKKYKMGKKG